jgi:LacI family transcriptional regulator
MGHRRVAYISGTPTVLPIRQRLAWFRRFARRNDFELAPELFETSTLNHAGGYQAARRLWTSARKRPTAIVAFSDSVAVGVLRYLQEQRVAVPGDVSVAAFDGTAVAEFTSPSLSTVSTPMYDIGKQAFELLLGAIDGKFPLPQNLNLPVKLLLRESVGPNNSEGKASRPSGLRVAL